VQTANHVKLQSGRTEVADWERRLVERFQIVIMLYRDVKFKRYVV
jgi:hypothetical protein